MDINKTSEHSCVPCYVLMLQNMPELNAIKTEILYGQKTVQWGSVVKASRYLSCIYFTWIKAVNPSLSGTFNFPREKRKRKKKGKKQETDSELSKLFNKGYWTILYKTAMTYSLPEKKYVGWIKALPCFSSLQDRMYPCYSRTEKLIYCFTFVQKFSYFGGGQPFLPHN